MTIPTRIHPYYGWPGWKTIDIFKTCPFCGHSNFLVRVGFLQWY